VIGQMIRSSALGALAVVMSSACAPNPPMSSPPVTQGANPALTAAEHEAASKAYALCLDRAAKRLDDHKSDPATIARRMLSACTAEFDADVKVHSRYLEDVDGKQDVASRFRETSLDAAAQLVLRNRKAAQSR
jgi:hypothetical protein